jgi:hypothetical protein
MAVPVKDPVRVQKCSVWRWEEVDSGCWGKEVARLYRSCHCLPVRLWSAR